ncbi:hypothetical protein GJ688_13125 [Heliobacillus mobilis]|uniref:SpoVT-AbrB domain-containing protein n=2 Tax=Heliobacterium TaxID=2697 RepID=A0A6I3SMC2_HELMO|nr:MULTISPECIES: hypothetical protein [Heliobacterium]MBC9784477.1 hypothetical protein [Heliobacterium chlorum]MTV49916.1 hypothetical protein [Heliobacterium mobile]
MQLTYLSKQGELSIPQGLWEAFPQGGLVRFNIDAEGRLVIRPIPHLQCVSSNERMSMNGD